ncbi:MAG: Uma2 family endonuclease, partial [Treponema sp.]|nr:Uma2 family endonuclease [Treponema sp.]
GTQLREKLQSSGCKTIVAPFDVYPLYEKGDTYTLVQPDIFLACDKSKLKDNSYNGAPKFIIEILSSNRSHDMVTKLKLYEKAGVAEYWMIDPDEQIISALVLAESMPNPENIPEHIKIVKWDGKYIHNSYSGNDEVPLTSVPGCTVDFKKVFEEQE